MSKGVQIAIAAASVFAGLAWLLASQSAGEGTFRYYSTVSDYLTTEPAQAPEAAGSRQGSRVHGFVMDGSIVKDLAAGYVEFVLHDAQDATLPVRYAGIDVPDLFQDGAEVVVEGRISDGVFVADRLLAKCPSKYEAEAETDSAA